MATAQRYPQRYSILYFFFITALKIPQNTAQNPAQTPKNTGIPTRSPERLSGLTGLEAEGAEISSPRIMPRMNSVIIQQTKVVISPFFPKRTSLARIFSGFHHSSAVMVASTAEKTIHLDGTIHPKIQMLMADKAIETLSQAPTGCFFKKSNILCSS